MWRESCTYSVPVILRNERTRQFHRFMFTRQSCVLRTTCGCGWADVCMYIMCTNPPVILLFSSCICGGVESMSMFLFVRGMQEVRRSTTYQPCPNTDIPTTSEHRQAICVKLGRCLKLRDLKSGRGAHPYPIMPILDHPETQPRAVPLLLPRHNTNNTQLGCSHNSI